MLNVSSSSECSSGSPPQQPEAEQAASWVYLQKSYSQNRETEQRTSKQASQAYRASSQSELSQTSQVKEEVAEPKVCIRRASLLSCKCALANDQLVSFLCVVRCIVSLRLAAPAHLGHCLKGLCKSTSTTSCVQGDQEQALPMTAKPATCIKPPEKAWSDLSVPHTNGKAEMSPYRQLSSVPFQAGLPHAEICWPCTR